MKKMKLTTVILAIVLITIVAFGGVYTKKQNRMENKIKKYSYDMDLKGTRTVALKVDTSNETVVKDADGNKVDDASDLTEEQITQKGYTKEEVPNNSQEILNVENYNKTKKVIEKRLKGVKTENYVIKLNEETGDITVELPENDQTDAIISNIETTGKFEIVDDETKEVLMNNDDIKTAKVMYGSNSSTTNNGTIVYLDIEFTKDGSKKLEDISNKYTKSTTTQNDQENAESENTDKETTEKKVTMQIDGQDIMSTSFDETIKTGKLQLSVGAASTDSKTVQEYASKALNMATILDSGKMPIKYNVDQNEYILSDITANELEIIGYVTLAIIFVALIILIIRYKKMGVLGAISYVGLVSILTLTIRYTNVVLSIDGLCGATIVLILNYVFINKLLTKLKIKEEKINREKVKKAIKETYKEFFINIIPICIVVIVFCFVKWSPISSFGMVLFWGITLITICNFIITNSLLKIETEK